MSITKLLTATVENKIIKTSESCMIDRLARTGSGVCDWDQVCASTHGLCCKFTCLHANGEHSVAALHCTANSDWLWQNCPLLLCPPRWFPDPAEVGFVVLMVIHMVSNCSLLHFPLSSRYPAWFVVRMWCVVVTSWLASSCDPIGGGLEEPTKCLAGRHRGRPLKERHGKNKVRDRNQMSIFSC